MEPLTLTCTCGGAINTYSSPRAAYNAGWRLGKSGPICPTCAAEQDRRHYAECERRYGKEATAVAEESVKRLLG
jgi:hypothetical protein